MENQEKRQIIERALRQFFWRYRYAFLVKVWDRIITHLAEEVMVVGCEVEHTSDPLDGEPWTVIHTKPDDVGTTHNLFYQGHHGDEGPALVMIVPQESE